MLEAPHIRSAMIHATRKRLRKTRFTNRTCFRNYSAEFGARHTDVAYSPNGAWTLSFSKASHLQELAKPTLFEKGVLPSPNAHGKRSGNLLPFHA
jgi:hypothetical protein